MMRRATMASDGKTGERISQSTLARRAFRAQMRKPWVIAIVIALVAGGVVLALAVNRWLGLGVAVLGPILFLYLVPGWIASRRAEKDFFTYYAAIRRLDGPHESGMVGMPGRTPLLMKGSSSQWDHVMLGQLPGGLNGVLGRYTFVIVTHDSDGDSSHYFHFTTVVAGAPEAAAMPNIYCHRHILGGGGHIVRAEDQIGEQTRRIQFESAKLNGRYDVRIPTGAEENQVRQIFDPLLVDYLADEAPEGFNFEFYGGSVCAYVEKRYDQVDELDALCEAASMVAKRFSGEAREEV
jgi:hypothetical protein